VWAYFVRVCRPLTPPERAVRGVRLALVILDFLRASQRERARKRRAHDGGVHVALTTRERDRGHKAAPEAGAPFCSDAYRCYQGDAGLSGCGVSRSSMSCKRWRTRQKFVIPPPCFERPSRRPSICAPSSTVDLTAMHDCSRTRTGKGVREDWIPVVVKEMHNAIR